MTSMNISRSTRAFALATLVVVGACADDDERVDVLTPQSQPEASLRVNVSDLNAGVGDRIALAIEVSAAKPLSGVQGHLRFDPARLKFLGQIADRDAWVVINESALARGEIRLASFSGTELAPRVAKFAFEVRTLNYTGGLSFTPEVIGDLEQNEVRAKLSREIGLDAKLTGADEPVRWSYIDWAMFADPSVREEAGALRTNIVGLPATGTVYGDVTLNGTINVLDASDVANTAVGNREVIIGTTTVDRVTTANVRPLAAGACLAGFSGTDCSTRVINVLDVAPIATEALPGGSSAVVGDPIPLPKSAYAAGDTVFVPAGVILGNRRFDRDSLYVLQGIVSVGQEASPNCNAGELEIESGTKVLGQVTSALFITRCGRILAIGTPTQPITFTCRGEGPTGIAPGCWGGVFVSGNAVINEQDIVSPPQPLGPAPQLGSRNPVGGQNQRRGEGGAVNHGGGNDADSSGVIRYVRFMYGGRDLGNNNELNNLTVGSCGSGTRLDHIQVHAGEDDGLEFFGGRCDLKYLYATGNDDDQFDYSFGYDGDVQFVLEQHCRVAINDCDKNFEVDNTETAATYNNTPRTNPRIFNVTQIGGEQAGIGTTHVHYRRGAGGSINNSLIIRGDVAFIVDNSQTCNATSGFAWNTTVVMSVDTLLKGSAGCTPAAIQLGVNVDTATYVSQLKDPFNVTLPDYRPVGNGVTSSVLTPAAPPAGSIFDTAATYFGAVAPVGLTPGSVPWYAGWTLGWQGAALR